MQISKCIAFMLLYMLSCFGCQSEQVKPENNPSPAINNQKLAEGKKLFEGSCVSCHAIFKDMSGPKLGGITQRRDKKWLHDFTRNAAELIRNGDTAALNISNQWNNSLMPLYLDLDSLDIENIYLYIEHEYSKK
jgi:cytochrome c2